MADDLPVAVFADDHPGDLHRSAARRPLDDEIFAVPAMLTRSAPACSAVTSANRTLAISSAAIP